MNLRVDYEWSREDSSVVGDSQYDFFIDCDAPDIKNISDIKGYLREYAKGWTGRGRLKILSVSESFKNELLEKLSESLKGQIIEFNEGSAVFTQI